jgi:hypothetical protein
MRLWLAVRGERSCQSTVVRDWSRRYDGMGPTWYKIDSGVLYRIDRLPRVLFEL